MNGSKRNATLRLTAVLVALCLVIMPVQAQAAETAVTKYDISDAVVTVTSEEFYGWHAEPTVTVTLDGVPLSADTDYSLLFENDVNIGTATVRVVGKGNYYGSVTKEFQITHGDTTVTLPGAYMGNATGELSDEFYYSEGYLSPGLFRAYTDCNTLHQAYYALYLVEGETSTLILEETKEEGIHNETMFTYDFTSVYNSTAEAGGEVYMLVYTWMTRDYSVYAGALVMYIPAKVADATAIYLEQAEDGDFRADYFAAYGEDGDVSNVTWISSDPAVADVDRGVVTWKKPGTITVTAQFGDLTASQQLTMAALDITQGTITGFSGDTAEVVYDGRLLIAGTDYTVAVAEQDGVTEVTVTGCGLFTGQLVQQYQTETGEAIGHSHGFTDSCDTTCGSCDFTRTDTHRFSDQWSKDLTGHWHGCTACGEKADYAEHTLSPEDETLCTVCGTLYIPGDIDGNMIVNRDDVIQLLLHISMPEAFPIKAPADFNGDSVVNRDDVVQLLLHISMPDAFPLQA